MRQCPNCGTDINFFAVYKSSAKKPVKCAGCDKKLFQYRFLSAVTESIGAAIGAICGYLLVLMLWGYFLIGICIALFVAYGGRIVEVFYSKLHLIEAKDERSKQMGLSFLGFFIGMLVFFPTFFYLLERF